MKLNKIFTGAGLIIGLSSAVTAQTVINGTFNGLTGAGVKYKTELGTGTASQQGVQGWTSVNTGIVHSIVADNQSKTAQPHTSATGNAAWLRAGSAEKASASSISQTINFAAPGTYALSFNSFTTPWVFEVFHDFNVDLNRTTRPGPTPIASPIIDESFTSSGSDNAMSVHTIQFKIEKAGDYDLRFSYANSKDEKRTQDDVMIDNVSIDVAPEPSSTALLGLGALGLLIRRKR